MNQERSNQSLLSPQQQRVLLKQLLRERAQKPQRAAASSAQRRLWFIDRMEPPNPSYNIACHLTLRGQVDATLLERSLNELARRHGSLRTTFEETDGKPVQVVAPDIALELPLIDLTSTPVPAQRVRLAQLIREDAEALFDLRHGPLIRARLLRMAAVEHVFVFVMHHIISDGWSVGVLVRDLFRIYEGLRDCRSPDLAKLPIQYIDHSAQQQRWLQSDEFRGQLAYWTERLAKLPILELQTDRPRPPVKGYKGATHSFTLDPLLSRALNEFCKREGVTLFMALMSAFSVLLQRYSGQEDVVFGSPIANRSLADTEGLIGFFVNTLVMRTDLSGNPGFRELLRRSSEAALAAYANQDVPFEHLVEELRPERNPGRNPLFQVAFALQNEVMPSVSMGGLEVSRPVALGYDASEFDVTTTSTRVDLELHLWEGCEGLRGTWSYDVALFEAGTIERMAKNFIRLLQEIVRNPEARIAALPLLAEAERRQLLVAWNDTSAAYQRDAAVHELFESWVERAADAPALVFEDRELTYGQLNARANRLARYLGARAVAAGELVGVCLERGIDLIACILAIFKAGAVYVPLDPKYPESRLAYMLEDAALSAVLSQGNLAGALSDYAGRVIRIDAEGSAIAQEDAGNLAPCTAANGLAYVIYTSGSTGKPKGTLLEHRGLCKVSAEQLRLFRVGPGSRVLQFSSPNFDASLFDVVMALTTGATLVLARAEHLQPGPPLLKLLREQRITILTIPPSSLGVLAPEPLPDLKILNVAGEACPAELVTRWAPGRRFFNLYGPTECTIWSTANECLADGNAPHIGRAIANTKLYVLDRHGQPVPIGVPGELYIGGDGLARGYLNLPALTAEKFVAAPFDEGHGARLYRTGDKVRYRADGALEFIGRIDNQVKLRGFRIELGEIEAVLGRQPGVRSAVVLALQDRPGDAQLVAYVVMAKGQSSAADDLRAALQQVLPAHMVPAEFVRLDALPLTPNGKVDTRALPPPHSERTCHAEYIAPRSDLENGIASIWKEVLGIDRVGVDDNFFDLGGHSLRLVKVQEQLEKLTGHDLPIVALFQYPTIRSLATHLRDGNAPVASKPLARARSSRYEPIAVIGMAGRFPGAPDLDRFWRNLCDGVESIRFFTEEDLRAGGVDDALSRHPDYVPAKGYLEDADLFDARFFGYSPREAKLIDPQHRIFLEVSWQALENANCDPSRLPAAVGVYAGSSDNTYWLSLRHANPAADSFEGAVAGGKDFLATRVAYKMDLHGPAVTVQTACSTSLVAVHEACKSLLSGESGIALAGGVSVSVPLVAGYRYEPNTILSSDGHCRAFDEAAQGALAGDGVGVVVLKRLADAVADGDTIHAVIRGSAINNDGSGKVGYTAPSVDGQSQAIAAALAVGNVDPGTISYIEAHGTGTTLGDPIEIAALARVFGNVPNGHRIAIGSVKTNLGHLDAAAGIAGFIKTVLALAHRELPPSLHFTKPNPKLDIERTPFFVNDRLRPWETTDGIPRRAGVSSFGIGGTNAHVVLEEAPPRPTNGGAARVHQLLVLSGRSKAALEQATADLAAALERDAAVELADVAYTLQVGRKRFRYARIIVCRDLEGAIGTLRAPATSGAITVDQEPAHRGAVFLFSGQGSQHVDMARDLYQAAPCMLFREVVDECCDKLGALLGVDLRELMYPGAQAADATERLTQTRYAQPALFVVEYALARQWMAWGVRPAAMMGHSIGEYVAACLAGVMTLDDALRLVAERGRLMYDLPAGSMLSVPLPAGELEALLVDDLSIASLNGPAMSVASGTKQAVDALQARLARDGIEARPLHTSHAFHSPMMEPILDAFTRRVRAIPLSAPQIPYVSNLTGDWITAEQATDPTYYARHLRHAVRFSDGLERLFARPDWLLVEVGPGQALCTLARRHPRRLAQQAVLASLPRPNERKGSDEAFLLESLGQMWLNGVDPDWDALHAPRRCRRVILPTYPFERQRYWIDRTDAPTAAPAPRRKADPADWTYALSWRRVPVDLVSTPKRQASWLLFADSSGIGASLAGELRADGGRVVSVEVGMRFARLADDRYAIAAGAREDYARLIGELKAGGFVPNRVVHLWPVAPETAFDACLEQGFLSLVYLVQALESNDVKSLAMAVVTAGVHEITGDEAITPAKAMVMAPCKVIGMEHAGMRVRAIDVLVKGDDDLRPLARMLAADLYGGWRDPVVAYRGRYRWVQAFEPMPLAPPSEIPAKLRKSGIYLITGGFGDVGLAIAEYLARIAGARLALVSRTPVPAREHWEAWLAQHDATDAVSRRIRRAQALEALGAQVFVRQADVADEAQMAAALDAAERHFGAVHGVIHAACAEKQPVPIRSLTKADCLDQFRPQVDGLKVLERVLQGKTLDFLLVNSSLASVLGAMTSVAYTASSLFMDAFVQQHNRRPGSSWIAVNWDNWTMKRPGAETATNATPELYLNVDEGGDILGRALAHDVSRVVVSTGDLQRRIEQWLHCDESVDQDAGAPDKAAATAGAPRPALSTPYVAPRSDVERALATIWQQLLGITEIGVHDNFFELGGDSLLNIQITAKAKQAGLRLTPKEVFDHPTIAALCAVAGAKIASTTDQGIVTGPVPLTPIQHWFFDRDLQRPQHFNLPMLLAARGPLDVDILAQAIRQLERHHDALRLRYSRSGALWSQRLVEPSDTHTVQRFDVSGLGAAEQLQRIETIATELQQSLDLFNGPLLRSAYFDRGQGRSGRLLLVLHHLAVDMISWRLLIEDLNTVYRLLTNGQPATLPPKTASIKHWAQALTEYAQTETAEAELGHWMDIAARPLASLPVDFGAGINTVSSARTIREDLSEAETRALLTDLPRAYKTQISDALLLAMVKALCGWTGANTAFVDVEGHGREPLLDGIDVSRTVGWFTTLAPTWLELPVARGYRQQIGEMRKQLQAIAHQGMGFGLLRYLNTKHEVRAALEKVPKPEISFLYMGQFDQAFSAESLFGPASESIGPSHDPNGERAHLLEINSIVTQRRLQVSWTFSSNRHKEETVRALARSYMDVLRSLVASCQMAGSHDEVPGFAKDVVSLSDLAEIERQLSAHAEATR